MEKLEYALIACLVVLVAAGVSLRHFRDSQPPIQPVVIHSDGGFASPAATVPSSTSTNTATPEVASATAPLLATMTLVSETNVPEIRSTGISLDVPAAMDPIQQAALTLLNRANGARIEEIYGIGPKTAKNLIAMRQKAGGFASWEQVKEAQGIGDKRLEDIKNSFMLELQTYRYSLPPTRGKE
jgi:competence ComEA-like helix-hairpin-helix protein